MRFLRILSVFCLAFMWTLIPLTDSASAAPIVVTATANEGGVLTMNAPAGYKVDQVLFASYGTPNGTVLGSCHAVDSMRIVSAAIKNENLSIPATNNVFGDPCGGTYKRLTVSISYQELPPVAPLAPSNLVASLTATDITLTWDTPTAGTAIERYAIFWSSDNWATGRAVASTTNTITLSLEVIDYDGRGKDFSFKIRSDNDSLALYSDWSNVATVFIPALAPVPTPSPTPVVEPSPSSQPTSQPSPTATPEPSPSPSVTAAPEPTPTPTPTPEPSTSPSPTPTPLDTPTPSPSPVQTTPAPSPTPSPVVDANTSESVQPTPQPSPQPSPTPIPIPLPEPNPVPVPLPNPVDTPAVEPTPAPEPESTPSPTPQPEPSPSPEEPPVAIPDPEPTPEPEPLPVDEPTLPPVEEPQPIPSEPPAEIDPPSPTPEPQPSEPPAPSPESIEDILQDGKVTATEVDNLVDDLTADGKLTEDEKEIVATAIVAQFIDAPAVPASALIEAGLDFSDLPAETPVDIRTDENGNAVIITAEVADALELLASPGEIISAIFESPAQLIFAIGNLGADMSPAEREEATKTIVAATIVGNIATTTAMATVGSVGYRRQI